MKVRLTHSAVLDFGAGMLRQVLGENYPGTVMLAGGAFKSLLHGRPPRDLDLWAANDSERARLVSHLTALGATPLADTRYTSAYQVHGQIVEVPKKSDRVDFSVHLERVDIGVAAVAVRLDAGQFTAALHPLAIESEQRREVLFVRPLANWRHCLGCLARARRYACELEWKLPAREEAYIWELFDGQDTSMQRGMLERGSATAIPDPQVLSLAFARMKK